MCGVIKGIVYPVSRLQVRWFVELKALQRVGDGSHTSHLPGRAAISVLMRM